MHNEVVSFYVAARFLEISAFNNFAQPLKSGLRSILKVRRILVYWLKLIRIVRKNNNISLHPVYLCLVFPLYDGKVSNKNPPWTPFHII